MRASPTLVPRAHPTEAVAGQTPRVGFAHRHMLVDIDVHESEYHVYDWPANPSP